MSAPSRQAGRRWAWQLGYAVVVLAAGVGLVAGSSGFPFGNLAGSNAQVARKAPCLPGEPVPILDSPHIARAEADAVTYNSLPPTSGPHFAFTIATGVYDEPVPDGLTVHAMEHGHIVIHYAPGLPDGQVAGLERLARRYGGDVVLAPNSAVSAGVALTAWGRIDRLDRFDQRRTAGFVTALRDRYQHGWTTDQEC